MKTMKNITHHDLQEGTRVRVTRYTSRAISSSEGVITGEESFEGVVKSTSKWGAMVYGDNGEMQNCATDTEGRWNYPAVCVEIL